MTVAVIGAGVVGLATARALQADGHDVTLIDPAPPGSGASHGNAGTIADYAVDPVGAPAIFRDLPRLMFDRTSPFALAPGALPGVLPWLARFLRQSRPAAAGRNARVLAGLVHDAGPLWQDLAAEAGAAHLLHDTGCLYLYRTPAAFAAGAAAMRGRSALGVAVEMLDARQLEEREPGLPPFAGAAHFHATRWLSDPGAMMAALARGLRIARARVTGLSIGPKGITLSGDGLRLEANHAVIAAGAASAALARMAGDRVPLEVERGYHAEWDGVAPVRRPVCPVDLGFYLCPMTGRLRAAGTVELGRADLPPTGARIDRLVAGARSVFPDLGPPDRTWLGLRPSLPDSLPVIGPSAASPRVIHAFGHGHIGVTLAPMTARVVVALVAGRAPDRDIAALRPARFG
jgi:D-amino-acid dehydrogenase